MLIMEGKSSEHRPEKCISTGSTVTTSCKPKAKLRRHKSLEDLRLLKSTQEHHIISIFFEYVHSVRRQSTSTNAPARTTMPESEHDPQVSTRPTTCRYRRLRSEPSSRGSGSSTDNSIRDAKCENGELLQASSSSKRPCTLNLEPQHRRMPSSDSSGKTTPAPDPPLFSPAAACELQMPCLVGNQNFQRLRSASSPILPPSHMEVQVGTPQSQRHLCAAQVYIN